MPHQERSLLIISLLLIFFNLFSSIENDYKEALKIVEDNSDKIVNTCATINDLGKLKYFARNSKNPKLITQALRYLSFKGEKGADYKVIADSLVNSDFCNDLLLKEFARNNIPINNQDAVIRLYKMEKSSIYAKQIHDQKAIIEFLKDEKSLGMRHTFLRNLTDESTLEKYALEADDWGTKEIVYWRLNDSLFISKLINKEENEKYSEILRTRLDMLNPDDAWFIKLCERQIEKIKPDPLKSSLSDEDSNIREFLIYFYSDVYKSKLSMLKSENLKLSSFLLKSIVPSLIPYITIQDTIRYAIDDKINETSSILSLHKLDKQNIKSLPVANLNLKITSLKNIYFDNKFRDILISFSNNSTYAYPKSELYLRNINVKKCIEAKYDVISFPEINMIFNSDFTKVKIDSNSGDKGETKFYLKNNGNWVPSDKDGGGSWIN